MSKLWGRADRPFLQVLITLAKVNATEQIAFKIRPATREEIDILCEGLCSVQSNRILDPNIWNIIAEDVEPYFEDSRTIDEVMDLIQGRVSFYVSKIISRKLLYPRFWRGFFGFLPDRPSQNRSIELELI